MHYLQDTSVASDTPASLLVLSLNIKSSENNVDSDTYISINWLNSFL